MQFSLYDLFEDIPLIHIVDVGASLVDGPPLYQGLIDRGKARVIGFEPDPMQYEALRQQQRSGVQYLPYAIGDGKEAVLNLCLAPGMNSLLEPDFEILNHFHGFGDWGSIVHREKVATRTLDDVTEIEGIDYLHLDVQGSELAVIQGAARRLEETVVLQTEVQFVPFYKDQPLFAELDQALRKAGFHFHRFGSLHSRIFKPLTVNNDPRSGLSQLLWSDAVYVKAFPQFARQSTQQLLKIAAICHELYHSYDLVGLALGHVDRQEGTDRQSRYFDRLMGGGVQSAR